MTEITKISRSKAYYGFIVDEKTLLEALQTNIKFAKNLLANNHYDVWDYLEESFENIDGIYWNKTEVIEGSHMIMIGKNIMKMKDDKNNAVVEFVEQSTLVHELGHLAGLVNNGAPTVSDHEDKEHPHHCTNPNCVMRWENEGLADLLSFLIRIDQGEKPILYCSQCLEDMKHYLGEKNNLKQSSK